ncbi:MAG: M24 family metallopeptidase [Dehalococcoidia bacterium]
MVKMAPKLTFTTAATDTQEGIDVARMREERATRVRQVLRQHGVPSILVTGAPNVRYLTGFHWAEFQPRLSYSVFFAEHDPVVFAHAGSYQQMPEEMPWIKHWRIGRAWMEGIAGAGATQEEAKVWAQEIRQELAERGLAGEPLAVVGYDSFGEEALRAEGLKIVAGAPLLLEASKIKTQDEINCLKMTATFSSVGWQTALEVLRPGGTTGEVALAITNAMHRAGAEFAFAGILFGPMAFERNVTLVSRRIEHGELGYIPVCGTSYMGYTCCQYRSFVVGRQPTSRERGWYDQLRDRITAVIDAIKPGATTADAARHFPPASKWGYKDEAEVLTVQWGHGIGLVQIDPGFVHYNWPAINRQWSLKHPQVFEPGMVIAIEDLEGEHRVGGVRMENMVVVTEEGAELIDHFPRDEILVAGA